jgi:hypothetical protein
MGHGFQFANCKRLPEAKFMPHSIPQPIQPIWIAQMPRKSPSKNPVHQILIGQVRASHGTSLGIFIESNLVGGETMVNNG